MGALSQDRRPEHEGARDGGGRGDDRGDRHLVVVVEAKVTVQRPAHKAEVLLPDRQVQPQAVLDQCDRLRRGLTAGKRSGHIAWRDEEEGEDDHRDQPQDKDAQGGSANEETQHVAPIPLIEELVGAWVERVADAVTEQVEGQGGEEQRRTREDDEPPRGGVVLLAVADHAAPVRCRRWQSETEVRQCGLHGDHHRDEQSGVDDDRRQDVGQDVDEHDPGVTRAQGPCCLDELAFS